MSWTSVCTNNKYVMGVEEEGRPYTCSPLIEIPRRGVRKLGPNKNPKQKLSIRKAPKSFWRLLNLGWPPEKRQKRKTQQIWGLLSTQQAYVGVCVTQFPGENFRQRNISRERTLNKSRFVPYSVTNRFRYLLTWRYWTLSGYFSG